MPVVLQQVMPPGVTIDILDAVTEQMGVKSDPPTGLVLHTHFEDGGEIRIIDVWESEDDYHAFAEQRLLPAMAKVAADRGLEGPEGLRPEQHFAQTQTVIRGR